MSGEFTGVNRNTPNPNFFINQFFTRTFAIIPSVRYNVSGRRDFCSYNRAHHRILLIKVLNSDEKANTYGKDIRGIAYRNKQGNCIYSFRK